MFVYLLGDNKTCLGTCLGVKTHVCKCVLGFRDMFGYMFGEIAYMFGARKYFWLCVREDQTNKSRNVFGCQQN